MDLHDWQYRLDGHDAVRATDDEHLEAWKQRRAGQKAGHDPWRVAADTLPDGRYLSTVFLGVDYAFGLGGPPELFETMLFAGENNLDGQETWRWSTWDEATAGHAEIAARLRDDAL